MASVAFGPGLAGFPAFPVLPLDAFANFQNLPPEVQQQLIQTFQALNFQFTPTTFSFELNSAIFGRPGAFDYKFTLTGDFSALAADPSQVFAALNPAYADYFQVRWQEAETRNLATGDLAIAAHADTLGPPVSFLTFFSTLLNPANYTQDLLTTFTGNNLAQFDTLDLSGFQHGVISGRPNGATVSHQGTISEPGGNFLPSFYGVVSFNGEVLKLQFDHVIGGAGNDVLAAGANATTIDGGAGNDLLLAGLDGAVLNGGGDNDVLAGGAGNDRLSGGDGNDVLIGGAGANVLDGGIGNDTLYAGLGKDVLTGGAGADRFVIQKSAGSVTEIRDFNLVDGDTLDLSGLFPLLPNKSALSFGFDASGDLTMTVGKGGNAQTVIFDGLTSASDVMPGLVFGAPSDTLVAGGGSSVLQASAHDSILVGQGGNDRLYGGAANDLISGGDGNDTLAGGDGNDVLFGGNGNDKLVGGNGDDVLDGGAGNDVLQAGAGHDVLTGGYGADTFMLSPQGYARITDFEPGQDVIDLSSFLRGKGVTDANFDQYVKVVPLGPTELTGFIEVDRDGAGSKFGFQAVAQIDGAAFQIVNGASVSVLTPHSFVLG